MLKKTLQKLYSNLFSRYESKRLKKVPFAIISNNCWGHELYKSTRREYNTPFIGLFMFPECYLALLRNFDKLINNELKFSSQSKYFNTLKHYPIGILGGDVEIHFLHYKTQEEATEKWNRRCDRLRQALKNNTPLYVKLCDNDGCTKDQLVQFHALDFAYKISIGLQQFPSEQHFYVPGLINKQKGTLIDGAKLFNKRYRYFDITQWILNGNQSKTLTAKVFGLLP